MTRLRFLNRWVLFAVVAGAIALFMDQDYYYTLLNFIGIHTLLVVGLNLLLGYAGQISLGHAAFFGLGAYTSGILTATCRRRSLAGPGGRAGGLRHCRLPDRHPGPEAPGLLPGHGHPRVRHHRLHHLERSLRTSPADLRGSAASRRCPWPASPSTPPGASIC